MTRLIIEDLSFEQAKLLSEQLGYIVECMSGIFETVEPPMFSLPRIDEPSNSEITIVLNCINGEE